jgi:hypothetical protein
MTFEEVVLYTRFAHAIVILLWFAIYSMINIATWIQHARGRGKKLQGASESLSSIVRFFDADKIKSRLVADTLLQEYQNKMRTVQEDLKVLYSWNVIEYMYKAEQKLESVERGLTMLLIFMDFWNCREERKATIQPVDVPQAREVKKSIEEADLSKVLENEKECDVIPAPPMAGVDSSS